MSTLTQSAPSRLTVRSHAAPIIVRTPQDLRAYLSGYAVPVRPVDPATIAALARMDAVLRMAVTGR